MGASYGSKEPFLWLEFAVHFRFSSRFFLQIYGSVQLIWNLVGILSDLWFYSVNLYTYLLWKLNMNGGVILGAEVLDDINGCSRYGRSDRSTTNNRPCVWCVRGGGLIWCDSHTWIAVQKWKLWEYNCSEQDLKNQTAVISPRYDTTNRSTVRESMRSQALWVGNDLDLEILESVMVCIWFLKSRQSQFRQSRYTEISRYEITEIGDSYRRLGVYILERRRQGQYHLNLPFLWLTVFSGLLVFGRFMGWEFSESSSFLAFSGSCLNPLLLVNWGRNQRRMVWCRSLRSKSLILITQP